MDLKKAYDAMDRERILKILQGYGVGPNMLRLIAFIWAHVILVVDQGGTTGPLFKR